MPALLVWLGGCGYVADPLPPSLNIPAAVTDLTVRQKGDRLVIDFTAPSQTTDGVLLKRIGEVDLRAGVVPGDRWDADLWAEHATRVPVEVPGPGPVHVEVSAQEWIDREVVFGVRVAGRKGRFSDWSNLVALRVVGPLEKPSGLRAEATAAGVRLTWNAAPRPGLRFRVWRRAEQQQQPELIAESVQPECLDATAEFGRTYQYSVAAVLQSGQTEAVSETSETVQITPEDRFAPATPSELSAVTGVQSIELAWEPNTEPDLRGYRVYRAADGGQLRPVAELIEAPSYSDRNVESGHRYRYAVTALDAAGNESAPAAPVEAAAP